MKRNALNGDLRLQGGVREGDSDHVAAQRRQHRARAGALQRGRAAVRAGRVHEARRPEAVPPEVRLARGPLRRPRRPRRPRRRQQQAGHTQPTSQVRALDTTPQ